MSTPALRLPRRGQSRLTSFAERAADPPQQQPEQKEVPVTTQQSPSPASIKTAQQLGIKAFKEGRSGAPARDRAFMRLLARESKGKPFGFSNPLLKAFASAHSREQRIASNRALQAQGFGRQRGL